MHRRCSRCRVEISDSKGNAVWFCCFCGDGPFGIWNPCCANCCHASPPQGPFNYPVWDHILASGIQIELNQIQTQEFIDTLDPTQRPNPFKAEDQSLWNHHHDDLSKTKGTNKPTPKAKKLSTGRVLTPQTPALAKDDEILGSKSSISAGKGANSPSTFEKLTDEERREIEIIEVNLTESHPKVGLGDRVQLYLNKRAENLVGHFWKRLQFDFDPEAGVVKCAGRTVGNCSTSAVQPRESSSSSSSARKSTRGSKRSRQNQNNDEEFGSDDDDDEDKQKSPAKKSKGKVTEATSRLACLFFKHSPRSCTRHRACSGPGWLDIYHLKEHLSRCHRIYQCSRCKMAFPRTEDLEAHQRATNPCVLYDGERHLPGINEKKWELIRPKIKPGSREEQWRMLYQVIFPRARYIPSPYYGPEDLEASDEDNLCDEGTEDDGFFNYCREQLPHRVQRLLEQAYREKLTNAAIDGSEHVLALINNQDFQDTFRTCFRRALDDIRRPGGSKTSYKGRSKERLQRCVTTHPSGTTRKHETDDLKTAAEDFMRTGLPRPCDWSIEMDLDDFNVVAAFEDWNWDSFDGEGLAENSSNQGNPSSNALLATITDNLALELPVNSEESTASSAYLPLPMHVPQFNSKHDQKALEGEEASRLHSALCANESLDSVEGKRSLFDDNVDGDILDPTTGDDLFGVASQAPSDFQH